MVALCVLLCIAVASLLLILKALMKDYFRLKDFPGPKLLPILGNFFEVIGTDQSHVYNLMRKLCEEYGTFRLWGLGTGQIHTSRMREAEILLSSSRHVDKSEVYEFIKDFLGTGLLVSNGQKWQTRRKLLTPAFHFQILQQFTSIFNEEISRAVERINGDLERRNGAVVRDISNICCRASMNVICETAMGVQLESIDNADEYRKNIYKVTEIIVHRVMRPWLYSPALFKALGYQRQVDACVKITKGFTRDVIDRRRKAFVERKARELAEGTELIDCNENVYETKKTRYAMLDLLLEAETKGLIDAEGIQEEVDTFMFEGHDTTSSGLTFAFLLIATYPEVQQRLYEELREAMEGNNGDPLSISQLNDLPYFDRVIKECLRIYTPVTFVSRSTTEEIELEGMRIPPGTMIHLHILNVHRDPEIYPEPEKFDPDRFLPENSAKRNPFAFIPFSAGPRNCIGQKFALLEMKSMIAQFLLNFHLSAVTQRKDIKFIADLVLRASHPILIEFTQRSSE